MFGISWFEVERWTHSAQQIDRITIAIEKIAEQAELASSSGVVNWTVICSWTAVAIAFVAMIVTWRQSKKSLRMQDQHNRLSVRPYLQLEWHETTELASGRGFIVSNQGFGPAIIKKVDIYVDNELVEDASDTDELWNTVWEKLGIALNLDLTMSVLSGDARIKTDAKIILLGQAVNQLDETTWEQVRACHGRLRLVFEYTSIYEDCVYKSKQPLALREERAISQ